MIEPSRRGLITGLGALIAAPAIVRATSLMPVKPLLPDYDAMLEKEGLIFRSSAIEITDRGFRIIDKFGRTMYYGESTTHRIAMMDYNRAVGIIRTRVYRRLRGD